MEPRTVTLEILRHGPPHNQLLSPLTQYLALCGNHQAVTVHVPFEHKQMVTRLRALGYKDSDETRQLQLAETADMMGQFLAQIPGLIAELADGGGWQEHSRFTHLRLILSASELALLPIELATAPNGFPAAGQALTLQSQAPLCITREVRRDTDDRIPWMDNSETPRILFIAASPPKAGPIPFDAHLLVLRKAIEHWVVRYFGESEMTSNIDEHLRILPQASVDQIQQVCAEQNFTHVHILAHGVPLREAGDERTGLALHDSRDPSRLDIVDGQRLAALLHPCEPNGKSKPPCVVTLAVCDSGNVGSVEGAGGSVAHALHESGIPLVIASQFPLSFHASVLVAEVLDDLLWGEDPRRLLLGLRHELRTRITRTDPDTNAVISTHDWASLVAYASLPKDLDERIPRVQLQQAGRSIKAAFSEFDAVCAPLWKLRAKPESVRKAKWPGFDETHQRIDRAKAKLEEIARRCSEERVQVEGLLASTEKRLAEIFFWKDTDESTACLRRAADHYERAFNADHSAGWALVQRLVIDAVLDGRVDKVAWNAACCLNQRDLALEDHRRVAWAAGSLIELRLLAMLKPSVSEGKLDDADIVHWTRRLNDSPHPEEIYNTRRQIRRYEKWFSEVGKGNQWKAIASQAARVADMLTRADEFKHTGGRPNPNGKKR